MEGIRTISNPKVLKISAFNVTRFTQEMITAAITVRIEFKSTASSCQNS